jgi:hypothetical protein
MHASARLVAVFLAAVCALVVGATAASGATPGALYSYTLDGSTDRIPNQGTSDAALELRGTWSPSANGVRFDGDRAGRQSGAFARPAPGPTLRVASATHGVGVAIAFTYDAPDRGCYADTVNLTQIGRAAKNSTQIKLQLSDCGNGGGTSVQCRMVGNVSKAGSPPSRNSMVLVDGARYVAQCLKGPDPRTGTASMTIRVTRVDTGQVAETRHSIARTGTMSTSEALSVANKFPLPAKSRNTDQFVGEVARVAYCTATSFDAVRGCLDAEMSPAPLPAGARLWAV